MIARRTCIGVFDSGFGGLTVLKALLRLIPDADYLYFGDTARLPYGSKSAETVARYAVGAAHYLEQRGAQALVIACNTATALALDKITQAASVPVVGVIEPGTERAAGESENKKVVVIGTEATVSSHAYLKALEARGMQAREKACPLLVPLVEEGWIDHPVTEEVARIYLKEAFADEFKSADVLLLGCTHYPLIQPVLSQGRTQACQDRRLRRCHSGCRWQATAPPSIALRASTRAPQVASADLFRHRLGRKVSPSRRTVPRTSG